jgi:hypothetical protein
VALVAGLVSFAVPRVRRDVVGLYVRPLYRGSVGVGAAVLAVALANELALLSHAALQSLTATVAVSGLVLIAHGWNRRQSLLGYAGVGLLEVAYMLQLTLFDVGQPQAFVLPAGLYLLVIAYLEWRRGTGAGLKMVLEAAALLLLLSTSLLQSLGYLDAGAGRYACEVFLLFESVALVGLGAVLHWKRTFFAGSAALVADIVIMLADPLRAMNTWYLMAIVGCAMIALVVFIEQRRQRIPLWIDEWRLRLETWD